MNILILNWRDTKNPRSGGAEVITEKYAAYWTELGHKITWITSRFDQSDTHEVVNGQEFYRVGPKIGYSVVGLITSYPIFLISAISRALKIIHTNHVELVIDEVHGLPFFTPLFSKVRNVLLVCEVAGTIWDKMFPFPINLIGKTLEKLIYFLYRNTETWAISRHTQSDIYQLNKNINIKVLPLGIDPPKFQKLSKFPFPSAVFLGRLVRMKGLESAILAAREIVKKYPDFKLFIIGSGSPDYLKSLKTPPCVKFLGRLSEKDKSYYLTKSHFLIHPSYKEGFGLTVLEAASLGTPTIGRSGSSLDELISHNETGLLFRSEEDISGLFIANYNSKKYEILVRQCEQKVKDYYWTSCLSRSKSVTKIS